MLLQSHIQREYEIITKTVYQIINVLSTKAEIFAIRCGICQASQMQGITSIVIHIAKYIFDIVTNFIQFTSPQLVDQFSQTKLHYKAPNEGYLHIYGMYKSDNKQPRYQVISNCKIFVC